MKPRFPSHQRRRHLLSGLTLLEILVAVSLLVLIVGGLLAMFNQTQRVFLSGLRQVDVLEGGRAALEYISRDVEQMTPGKTANSTNFYSSSLVFNADLLSPSDQVMQKLTFQDLFFLGYGSDRRWEAVGFKVVDPVNPNGNLTDVSIGALYRFSTNNQQLFAQSFLNLFYRPPLLLMTNGNLSRVIDGVVHFKTLAYDGEGRLFGTTNLPPTTGPIDSYVLMFTNVPTKDVLGAYAFSNEKLPAYVEIEVGVLEPEAVIRARALPSLAARRDYISKNSGKIHFFRQRIPIRAAPRPTGF